MISTLNSRNIYFIDQFTTRDIDIDFNKFECSQNELIKIMEGVENECPVAKEFGVSGIGEGVVCSYLTEDNSLIQFKVKGEKHSNSKVKTTKAVDTSKLDKLDACVEKICHSWRFEQALVETFGSDYEKNIDIKKISDVIKWVNSDTLKEELDIIAEFGFEPKEVLPKVSQKTKEYFFSVYKNM